MIWIKIALVGFIILESGNIFVLYFFPDSKLANGMGVFIAWERSKDDPGIHDLARYLVNWVAGTKLIFIGLLIVLLFTADQTALLLTAGVMALTISSFYWRLFPLIRKMDSQSQIEPPGYSKSLGWMIGAMILCFLAGVLAAYLLMR